MLYIFYIGTSISMEELKQQAQKTLSHIVPKNDIEMIAQEAQNISFDCSYFNLDITNHSESIQFTAEDYNLQLRYQFWFEVYYTPDATAESKMLQFIGQLLGEKTHSAILLFNGCKPILLKKDGKIFANDSTLKLTTERFPFWQLNIPYQEQELFPK